jgi:hypothetical protein
METWKTIKDFENYEISNYGNVKSKQTNKKEKILKKRITKFGYNRVMLQNKPIKKEYLIHRLVANAFIFNDDVLRNQVNHKDCDKSNNNVNNLEWCSQSENMIHSLNNGRIKKGVKVFRYINDEMKIYNTILSASIDNNISTASIHQCLSGKSKTCNNYKWKYLKDD